MRTPAKVRVNPEEEYEHEFEAYLIVRPASKRKGFFMAYNDSLFELVLTRNLASGDLKVLFYMVSQMGYDNVCEQTVTEVSEALLLTRQVASRAIQRLLKLQIITPTRTVGRATFYMVSPYIFIRVKASEQKKMIKKWDAIFEGVQPVLEVIDGRKSKITTYEERSRKKSKSADVTA